MGPVSVPNGNRGSQQATGQLSTFGLFQQIQKHASTAPSSVAITDLPHSLSITYSRLLADTLSLASTLLRFKRDGATDLAEERICILCSKGYLVPLAMLATWAAGGLAVPLLPGMPVPEHEYMVENSEARVIVCDAALRERADKLVESVKSKGGKCEVFELSLRDVRSYQQKLGSEGLEKMRELQGDRRAMMLFTSGTVSWTPGSDQSLRLDSDWSPKRRGDSALCPQLSSLSLGRCMEMDAIGRQLRMSAQAQLIPGSTGQPLAYPPPESPARDHGCAVTYFMGRSFCGAMGEVRRSSSTCRILSRSATG